MSSSTQILPVECPVNGIIEPVPLAPSLPTPKERLAEGKSRRAQAPRSAHSRWEPAANRTDTIALLEESSRQRLPHLIPIRYGRMLASPFTYLRGSPIVMAHDLAATPVSGIRVQACGDAHLMNFGLYASPERNLLFDLNDFDETLPGPWEWDVKRLAASVEVAGRQNGYKAQENRQAVVGSIQEYHTMMQRIA